MPTEYYLSHNVAKEDCKILWNDNGLRINKKTTNGENIWTYDVQGERKSGPLDAIMIVRVMMPGHSEHDGGAHGISVRHTVVGRKAVTWQRKTWCKLGTEVQIHNGLNSMAMRRHSDRKRHHNLSGNRSYSAMKKILDSDKKHLHVIPISVETIDWHHVYRAIFN
jgi:hypothetical protein